MVGEKNAASRRPPLLLPLLSHFSKCLPCGVDHLLHLLTTGIFPGVEHLCIIRWRFLGLVSGLGVIFFGIVHNKKQCEAPKSYLSFHIPKK